MLADKRNGWLRTYFKVVQKLSECHLLPIGLQTCDLKAIPQRPVHFIVLQKKIKCGDYETFVGQKDLSKTNCQTAATDIVVLSEKNSVVDILLSTHWSHQREKVSYTHLHPGRQTVSAWCIGISMAGSSLEDNTYFDCVYCWELISKYFTMLQLACGWKTSRYVPCVWEQRWAQRRQRKAEPGSWSHFCMTPASCDLGQSWWAPGTPDPPLQLWLWRSQEWSCQLSVCSGVGGE